MPSQNGNVPALFDNLISVQDVAVALGVKPQTVRNWVANRTIPFVKVGRKTMFLHESVMAWLRDKEFKP